MTVKPYRKTLFIVTIAFCLLAGLNWKTWLNGWTLTRLAEAAIYLKYQLNSEIGLIEAHPDGGYSISDIKIYNSGELIGTPLLDCNYLFLTPVQINNSSLTLKDIQCCNGDIYIYMFPDGSTNLKNLQFTIPHQVLLTNLKIHFITQGQRDPKELTVILNGLVQFNPEGNMQHADLKATDPQGDLIAHITCSEPGLEIQGLDLLSLMKNKNALLITNYLPAFLSLKEQFSY